MNSEYLESFKQSNVFSSSDSLQNYESNESWRVGFICIKDCYIIVMEVLKALELMGFEWKLVSSSYKIKCKKKEEEGSLAPSLNVLIQIFSVRLFKIRLKWKMNILLIFIN